MRKLITLFLISLLLSACENFFDNAKNEPEGAIAPAELLLTMDAEITQLRIDIFRTTKTETTTITHPNGTTEKVNEDEEHHHLGFYLNDVLFADLNGNLSLSVTQLFGIQPEEDYEIEQVKHGINSDQKTVVKKEGLIITGDDNNPENNTLFIAEIQHKVILMDHRNLFPYRTFYFRNDRISERLYNYFFDLTFIRIRKTENGFISPTMKDDKNYTQPEPNKILLDNKKVKIIRHAKQIEMKYNSIGSAILYSLPDGYVIDTDFSTKKHVVINPDKIEVLESDQVVLTFIRIQ